MTPTPIFVTCMPESYARFSPIKDEQKVIKRWFESYTNYDRDGRVMGTGPEPGDTLLEALGQVGTSEISWKYDRQSIAQIFTSIRELYDFAQDLTMAIPVWYSADGYKPQKRFLAEDMDGYANYVLDLRRYAERNNPGPASITPHQEFLALCKQLGWVEGNTLFAAEWLGITRQSMSALRNGHHQPSPLMLRYMRFLLEGSKK